MSSTANPAEYSLTITYDTPISNGGSENDGISITTTNPTQETQHPYVGLQVSNIFFDNKNYYFSWATSIKVQNNSIISPNGVFFKKQNFTIFFDEPTSAANKKIRGELALEIIKPLQKYLKVYAGISVDYEEETMKYDLGDWTINETNETIRKQIYSGIELKLSSRLEPAFRCQTGFTINQRILQCGLSFKIP